MQGIAAILHNSGWACSNEVVFDADKHLVDVDGVKMSKEMLTIKVFSIFDTVGILNEGDFVECLFKADDDTKFAFVGSIKSRGKQLTVIHDLKKSERYLEILAKIKA